MQESSAALEHLVLPTITDAIKKTIRNEMNTPKKSVSYASENKEPKGTGGISNNGTLGQLLYGVALAPTTKKPCATCTKALQVIQQLPPTWKLNLGSHCKDCGQGGWTLTEYNAQQDPDSRTVKSDWYDPPEMQTIPKKKVVTTSPQSQVCLLCQQISHDSATRNFLQSLRLLYFCGKCNQTGHLPFNCTNSATRKGDFWNRIAYMQPKNSKVPMPTNHSNGKICPLCKQGAGNFMKTLIYEITCATCNIKNHSSFDCPNKSSSAGDGWNNIDFREADTIMKASDSTNQGNSQTTPVRQNGKQKQSVTSGTSARSATCKLCASSDHFTGECPSRFR